MKTQRSLGCAAMLFYMAVAHAQVSVPGYAWAFSHGTNAGVDEGRAITAYYPLGATSPDIYAAGTFSGSITLGGTTYTSLGGRDIYVVRYNSTTGAVVASRQFGTAGDDEVADIAIPPAKTGVVGYVNICGRKNGNIPFIARYPLSLSGTPVEASISDAGGMVKGLVAVGTSVYATGILQGDAIFSGTINVSINTTCSGSGDPESGLQGGMFVARFNQALVANSVIQPFTNGCSVGNDIAFHANRLYICGSYRQQLRFRNVLPVSASQLPAPQGPRDVFVCSVNAPSNGTSPLTFDRNDQKAAGSAEAESQSIPLRELAYSVVASTNGVFVAGSIGQFASFGTLSVADRGPFLAHYPLNTTTGMLVADWVYGATCNAPDCSTQTGAYGLALSGNSVWVTGALRNNATLNGAGTSSKTFPGTVMNAGNTGFLASYTATGTLNWAGQIKGNWTTSEPPHAGRAIAYAGCDLYYTGRMSGTACNLGNTPITLNCNALNFPATDVFVAKTTSNTAIQVNQTFSGGAGVIVNPIISAVGATGYLWSVSPSATIVGGTTATPTITFNATGTYTVTCTTTGGSCPATVSMKYFITIGFQEGNDRYVTTDNEVLQERYDVRFLPNPSDGDFSIDAPQLADSMLYVELLDASGRAVFTSTGVHGGRVVVPANSVNNGLYICRISANGVVIASERLILQR